MSRYIDIHTHFPTGLHIEPQGVGIHPWHSAVKQMPSEDEFTQADLIGEIGLDYVCDVERGQQERVFRAQLAIAERLKKVVVLHCVKAFEPTMKILEEYDLRAVIFHGFIGSKEQAQRAIKKGYYLSFGDRTWLSPKTIEALRNTPLEQIFIETDEADTTIDKQYLEVARVKGILLNELQQHILDNYNRIFAQHE
jgi:TatD DNase family protein